MMEADRLLAERLQIREREELTDEEKEKLFMELIEKRRKHFVALRAQKKRNRPPTKAQKRSQMSTCLKHMGGYKHKQLMGKSYDEIQKLFDKEMKRVNTFVAMSSEAQESNKKKVEGSKEKAKGSRKKMLGRKRDDDIAIDAIPLATKPPVIVDYKLLKEGIMVHYQLIRADGSSKRYSSMIRLLQGIDKEDLQTLWKLVKIKHGDSRPEDEHERVLWGDLKVMFKPDIRSDVWRNLQGYMVTIWKLIDSSGVHFVSAASEKIITVGLQLLEDFLLIGINKWYQSFALRNFDLEDMEFESTNSGTTAKLPILKLVAAREPESSESFDARFIMDLCGCMGLGRRHRGDGGAYNPPGYAQPQYDQYYQQYYPQQQPQQQHDDEEDE
ncbi:hypothetical protein Tco_1394754 [Tanacetum coccineum]